MKSSWLGIDGAASAKQGLGMLPGSKHRLNPYHLRRALRPEDEVYREVCVGLASGEWERVEKALSIAPEVAVENAKGVYGSFADI